MEETPLNGSCNETKNAEGDPRQDLRVEIPGERKVHKKKNWSNQLEYILSILGNIVGFGNLWRFPYICQRNGGGAFLIPFVLALLTCGLPVFFLETAIGQFSAKSNVHVWSACPLFKGIGLGQFVMNCIVMVYYQHIIAWNIYYMGMSFSSVLPWTTCGNDWNTPLCTESHYNISAINQPHNYSSNSSSWQSVSNKTETNFTFAHTAVDEFFQYKALGRSEGVDEMGHIQWHLVVCLLAAWTLTFLCLIKGVTSVGKVVYVTALLPYVLLLVLLVRTLLLPGAADGVLAYLHPDFRKLLNLQVWMEALLQVFYSLGPGWGTTTALASYNKFNYNCLRNSYILTLSGEGTSMFSGLVIFTVLGFMAKQTGSDIDNVASSGPGLGFVVYTQGLSKLPLPQLWCFLFYVMMFSVGLDSVFTFAETLITVVVDAFPNVLRPKRVFVTLAFCVVCFLLGLIFTTNAGIFYFQLLDWYLSALCLLFFGVLECVIFMWIYGSKRFNDDVELMIGRRIPVLMNLLLCYVAPVLLSAAFVAVLCQFQPPSYGSYKYPYSSQVVGWVIAALPLIPVPVMAVLTLRKTHGSWRQRLAESCRPEQSWGPADMKYMDMYYTIAQKEKHSCFDPCRP